MGVPQNFRKRKSIQWAPKFHGSRRSKRTGNDDSGILRDHLRWNRSLLPSVRTYISAVSWPTP
jgi:hypothetical protein